MYTAGEIITNGGRFYVNQSEGMQSKQPALRSRLRYFLRECMVRAWTVGPLPQRHGNGTITIDTTGKGSFPSDFSSIGTTVTVFLTTGGTIPLTFMSEQELLAKLTQWPQQGQPLFWTRIRQTIAGVAQMQVWAPPLLVSSATVNGYNRRCLDPIDFPPKPTAVVGSTGNLTGVYKWKATYEWADGETEGGFESAALTVAGTNPVVTVPVSESRYVTSVKFYRTVAGGDVFYFSGESPPLDSTTIVTVNGVQCVKYVDSVLDVDLGDPVPLPSDAITGVEQFPEDFLETVLTDGLISKAMTSQGDLRDAGFWKQFERDCRRMWADSRPGQNQGRQLIQYGQRRGGGGALDVRYRYNG